MQALTSAIEEAKWILDRDHDDLELRFLIQKGIHVLMEARISF